MYVATFKSKLPKFKMPKNIENVEYIWRLLTAPRHGQGAHRWCYVIATYLHT
jgi:hypothetical protein